MLGCSAGDGLIFSSTPPYVAAAEADGTEA
jgi:hypothetical protein